MKPLLKILTSSAVMLGLVWGFVSCKGEPKEIPFIEYSLGESSCQWKNIEYDYSKPDNGNVLIINSNEKLENYIECTEDSHPEIDFSKNTLLLAMGGATYGIDYIDTKFILEAVNKYIIKVNVHTNATAYPQKWLIPIIVPKISNKTNITLIIKYGKL